MSAVIQTATPFIIQEVLLEALAVLESEPMVVTAENVNSFRRRNNIYIGDIVTNREDYNGVQHFRKKDDRWQLVHDQDEYGAKVNSRLAARQYVPITRFLFELNTAYETAYTLYLERIEEQARQRLEQERIARVEATRLQAIERARSQGYSVKETRNKGKIQLVLTRS